MPALNLPLALFTNGYRISKLVDSYDPKLTEAKELAKAAAQARIHAATSSKPGSAAHKKQLQPRKPIKWGSSRSMPNLHRAEAAARRGSTAVTSPKR